MLSYCFYFTAANHPAFWTWGIEGAATGTIVVFLKKGRQRECLDHEGYPGLALISAKN